MTGRDDKLPSVLVLAQDGRTAPLRTLGGKGNCRKAEGTIDVQRGYKGKNKEKVDMIEILSRLVYLNTAEIFPAGTEL